jgi:hypothetical protein
MTLRKWWRQSLRARRERALRAVGVQGHVPHLATLTLRDLPMMVQVMLHDAWAGSCWECGEVLPCLHCT